MRPAACPTSPVANESARCYADLTNKSMRKRVTFGPLICIVALASMNALARGGHGGGGHGGGGHASAGGGHGGSSGGSHGSSTSRGAAAGSQSSGVVNASSAQA